MTQIIQSHAKSKGDPAWEVKVSGLLLSKSQEVVQALKSAQSLARQVQFHQLFDVVRRKDDIQKFQAEREPTETRHRRLQEYWSQFHNSAGGIPAGRPSDSQGSQRSRPSSKGSSSGTVRRRPLQEASFSTVSVAPALLSPVRAGTMSASGTPILPAGLGRLGSPSGGSLFHTPWKTRASRSQCSAGSWGWWGAEEQGASGGIGRASELCDSSVNAWHLSSRSLTSKSGGSLWSPAASLMFPDGGLSLGTDLSFGLPMESSQQFLPTEPSLTFTELSLEPGDDPAVEVKLDKWALQKKMMGWWQRPPYVLKSPSNKLEDSRTVHSRPVFARYDKTQQASVTKSASLPSIRHDSKASSQSETTLRIPERKKTAIAHGNNNDYTNNNSLAPDALLAWQLDASKQPAMQHSFKRPWKGQHLKAAGLGTEQYLHSCKVNGLVPMTLPFVTGHSSRFKAGGKGLRDEDLLAFCAMLQGLSSPEEQLELQHAEAQQSDDPRLGEAQAGIQELDLGGNPRLSEQALAQLLLLLGPRGSKTPLIATPVTPLGASKHGGRLLKRGGSGPGRDPPPGDAESFLPLADGERAGLQLQHLSLQGCPSAGMEVAAGILIQLLQAPQPGLSSSLRSLRSLDLGGVPLAMRCNLLLCQAIRQHPSLLSVCLADTCLGRGLRSAGGEEELTRQCLVELLSSKSIRKLDLSWNSFNADAFSQIGPKLNEVSVLQSLKLSHCAAVVSLGLWISPVACFLESLAENRSLQSLDISGNHLDFQAALILEDALEFNTSLERFDISHNPLGGLGIRSLLRVLSRKSSGLQTFAFEQCCCSGALLETNTDVQVFHSAHPQGRYKLDLTRPHHRSLLRMLYKTAERLKMAPDAAFKNMSATPAYSHPSKDSNGTYQVPTRGELELSFSMESAIEAATKNLPETGFSNVLSAHFRLLRIVPAPEKVVPMLAEWKRLEGLSDEPHIWIDALAKDFCLNYAYLAVMGKSHEHVADLVSSLLPTFVAGQSERYLSGLLLPSMGDYVRMLRKSSNLINFNAENPTGRYALDLANRVDYSVAESLIILEGWETSIRLQKGLPDISQFGNHSHARNVRYAEATLPCKLADWIPLTSEILQLDYCSSKRPRATAEPLPQEVFDLLLTAVEEEGGKPTAEKLQALRLVSDKLYVSSLQMRKLLGIFKDDKARAESVVTFWNRVTDPYNEKMFRICQSGPAEENKISRRLGQVGAFPFMQPEQKRFRLDFKNYDDRVAASLLLRLAVKEKISNLRNFCFSRADGTQGSEGLAVVPRSWESPEKIPKEGIFEVDYMCAPEDRKFEFRKELLENFGGWQLAETLQAGDVEWWSSLTQAPADVVGFVFFIISSYGDTLEAFRALDISVCELGLRTENSVLTLSEFLEGCTKIGCRKFKGKDEAERLTAIFRNLDPQGAGKISESEWKVLDQYAQEIKLSIREFVQFCERTFGPHLSQAWDALDDDHNGKISAKEWTGVCHNKVNYFGPTMPIFRYIDKDDGGSISAEEFLVLHKFQAVS
ncbi:unnamed protein product [Polarella glacialis]|uniref:EF-hand domain-containing protein n=1 Tax=Polarella glacialis TaxID=89957 RepID=A0A813KWY2_POLGL|nr:unnamed protein product [Polarella glacialis]